MDAKRGLRWPGSLDFTYRTDGSFSLYSTAEASPRIRYMLFFLPVPVALAMTGSRGGLLSFMAAVAVALVIMYLKEPAIRKVAIWLAVAMVAFMVVLISSQAGW
jgi:hypothetical protein